MKALAVFPSSREVRLVDQPEPMIAGRPKSNCAYSRPGSAGPTVRSPRSSTARRPLTLPTWSLGTNHLAKSLKWAAVSPAWHPATWRC